MKMFHFAALFAFSLSGIFAASTVHVHAADATAVLGACDKDPKCGYTGAKNGDISGCSQHACFYCPADGKHQCFGVGARTKPGGKPRPGPVTIGGVKVEAPPPGVKVRPIKVGIANKPVTVNKMNTQKMNTEKSNMSHEPQRSSGGKHK
jgi:hypothetical protein